MITRAPERRPPPENHLPMMPYRMRTATPADAPFILSLHALPHVAAVLSAPTEEQVLGAMESPDLGNHLVVDGADAPVGLLLLAESTSWLYEVRRMAARDQGRGIGSFALAWRSTKAWCTNARARGLYEAQGFVHEGTWREGARRDDDGRYEDLRLLHPRARVPGAVRVLRFARSAPPPNAVQLGAGTATQARSPDPLRAGASTWSGRRGSNSRHPAWKSL